MNGFEAFGEGLLLCEEEGDVLPYGLTRLSIRVPLRGRRIVQGSRHASAYAMVMGTCESQSYPMKEERGAFAPRSLPPGVACVGRGDWI